MKATTGAGPNFFHRFEFKVVELLPEGKAIDQLKVKGYVDKYRALGQPVHLIGVEFSRGKVATSPASR
jgi:hypothetical protein